MSKVFKYGGLVASIVLIAFGIGAIYTGIGGGSIVIRAVVAGICLVPPAALMGATLPVVANDLGGRFTFSVQRPPRSFAIGACYTANLVGAVALLTSPPSSRPLDQLWRRIAEVNQVAPQLGAVASLVDGDFSTLAGALLLELASGGKGAAATDLAALIDEAGPLASWQPEQSAAANPIAVTWRNDVLGVLTAADITLR